MVRAAAHVVEKHGVIHDVRDPRGRWDGPVGRRANRVGWRRFCVQALRAPRATRQADTHPPRLGQGAFRLVVTDLNDRRCAVRKERTLPALEAAHIRPYADGGEHAPQNGMLLHRDIHGLFDQGYVTVTPEHRFEVSRRIREEFENGRHYYDLHGSAITMPVESTMRPDPLALRWHNESRYLGEANGKART